MGEMIAYRSYVDLTLESFLPALITVTIDDGVYTATKTYTEVLDLLSRDIVPCCYYNGMYYRLMASTDAFIAFELYDSTGQVLDYSWILFKPDGSISMTSSSHDLGELEASLRTYTDTKVADLVNSAPETLDTLGELAAAFQESDEVVDVLNQAITTKYSADNPPPYPVTSVEGKTGQVVLDYETWTFTLADGTTVTKNVVVK